MVALVMALLEHVEEHEPLRACLLRAGHEVVVVDSFVRAKSILREHAFDLIISDVHLENGGSVFDFLRWCKNHTRLSNTPFVLISVAPTKLARYLADGVQATARSLGAAKYINMDSFDSSTFNQQIAELLPNNGTAVPGESMVLPE